MPETRVALLRRPVPLESLVATIVGECLVDEVKPNEPCGDRKGKGSHRVEFTPLPDTDRAVDAIDQLLNGASGLRSRYAIDADLGEAANLRVCEAIANGIANGRVRYFAAVAEGGRLALIEKVARSLHGASAKFWYDDATDRETATDALLQRGTVEWAAPAPLVTDHARLAHYLGLEEQQTAGSARRGGAAPHPTSLTVKGAFVWDDGEEFVVESKKTRSQRLHRLHWT